MTSPREDRWLLPEGVEELLPEQAEHLERLGRRLVDLFRSWGYRLVVPPLIEYLESLLVGTGRDLELQTFKLTDQMSGRLLGVRADMTPQVARIDAHRLQGRGPRRLCYLGPVLRTRPEGLAQSRCPVQVGAELYGHAGLESDVEVLHLMLEALAAVGLERVHLDLGHVGVYRTLAREAGLDAEAEEELFAALQRKARAEIEGLLGGAGPGSAGERAARQRLVRLAELHGGEEVLDEARRALAGAGEAVHRALDELEGIAQRLRRRLPGVHLHYDLAELRGYHYQTGVVFAALVPGHGSEVARGGRYDAIGRAFGAARPATGFSADLLTLIHLSPEEPLPPRGILAPAEEDPALHRKVAALRAAGERVCYELPGQEGGPAELGCDRVLRRGPAGWEVVPAGEQAKGEGHG
ncbi:MAG: ATP phosphoribosyltransferase regulatory subunit [Gammaproteobacteria bacterium]|nr:MAG: ATP phosphoribosyltransferase regulatory subunit [Gammaproteobacteria bacterium]